MINRKKQSWHLQITERSVISPSLYSLVLIPKTQVSKKEFDLLFTSCIKGMNLNQQNCYKTLIQNRELLIADYTKEVAETKMQELLDFAKKNSLKFHFVIKAS